MQRRVRITYPAPEDKDPTGKPVIGKPRNQVMVLQLGSLNPITVTSGVKARLTNPLGSTMAP